MWSCVNSKSYVLVRQGLFKCRKRLCQTILSPNFYSKTQNGTILFQEDDVTNKDGKDEFRADIIEMRLRDFAHCFYISGWVPFHLMKECVSKLSVTDLSNTELNLLFLRSCGHILAACENKLRIDVTNAVWKKFIQAESHDEYHILLSVDAENGFYRNEVLHEMEKKSLDPNQTTYDLLLLSASESNNKAAFTTIKSLMENNGASFNENYLSSLIRLNTFDKNLDEIQSIEKTFYVSGRKPSNEVKFAVLGAYASLGSFNLLLSLIEKILTNDDSIKSNQLAHLIAKLSHCVTNDKIIQFINEIFLLELKMAIKDVNWLTAYLTSRQFGGVAFAMLKKLSWDHIPDTEMDMPPATLVALTSAFWNNDKKTEELFKTINHVESIMNIPWTMETALHGALTHQNSESAWIVLKEMQRREVPIRSHYFWPLIVEASCPKDMLRIIKTMAEFAVPLDTITLKSFVIERLLPRGVDPVYLEDRLVQAGVRSKEVVLALDLYFLENDQMDVALKRVLRPKFEGSTELVKALTSSHLRKPNDKSMISFLKILQSDRLTKTDWVGQVVVEVYSKNPSVGESLFKNMQSARIRVSSDVMTLIKAVREQAKLRNDIKLQSIEEYDESGNWPRIFSGSFLHPLQMNADEMEDHLSELRAKGKNTRSILRKLFLVHTNKRNIRRAKELLQELLELPNLEWSAAMLANKMQLFAMLGDADQSLDTYFELKTKFPKFNVDFYKVTELADALIQNDRLNDAWEILKDLPDSTGRVSQDLTSIVVLLETFSQKEISIEDLKNLINLLISKNYASPTNPLLSFCVNYHIKRGNLQEAVQEFRTLYQKYLRTPSKFGLLFALHSARLRGKLNNFDKLKGDVVKVLKSNPNYNPLDELYPAAQAGDKEEVLSIMSTISQECHKESPEWQCRQWAISDDFIPLELIVSAARELKQVSMNLSPFVRALADTYYHHGEQEKMNELHRILSQGEIVVLPEIRRTVDRLSRSCGRLGKAESREMEMEMKNFSVSRLN